MTRASAARRLADLGRRSSCSTSGWRTCRWPSRARWPSAIAQLRDELDDARAAASRCTSTCPTSGSRPTARRPSPSRSTSRIRGSRSSRRRRCSRSKAASTSGACASCATRPGTPSTTPSSCGCAGSGARCSARRRKPYPEFYTPKPYSKSFVLHLDAWYAQSHPDEDFAETFAVWLTPNSEWRQRYAGWPALQKLEYMDALMHVAARPARRASTTRRRSIRCATLRKTLRQHYRNKRRHYGVDYPNFYDRDLRRLFSDAPEFTRQHHRGAVHRPHPPPGPPRRRRAGPASTSTRSTRCSRT